MRGHQRAVLRLGLAELLAALEPGQQRRQPAPAAREEPLELVNVRLDVQAHAVPAQAVLGRPLAKGGVAGSGLRRVVLVEPVALLGGQQLPGDDGNARLAQAPHHGGPLGCEVQQAQTDGGPQRHQVLGDGRILEERLQRPGSQLTEEGQARRTHERV